MRQALAEQDRIDELRARADTGNRYAVNQLAELLATQGRIDEVMELLRARTNEDRGYAHFKLVNLLIEYGRTDELRALIDTGGLANLLDEQGGPGVVGLYSPM